MQQKNKAVNEPEIAEKTNYYLLRMEKAQLRKQPVVKLSAYLSPKARVAKKKLGK